MMKEDNIEKARQLLEECGDFPEHAVIKQHSIYFTRGYYPTFYSKYIRQCKGVIVSSGHLGSFSIHKWGTHIGVPINRSFLFAHFHSIVFDLNNYTIKIITQWDDASPTEQVGKFKPEVFKELYETIPGILKTHGIYDCKESWNDNLLTLNIITNIPAKLEKRIRFNGRFEKFSVSGITRTNNELKYNAAYNNHEFLVRIFYEDSENRYSIRLIDLESGASQQSKLIKEADIFDTHDKMLMGEYTDEPWELSVDEFC